MNLKEQLLSLLCALLCSSVFAQTGSIEITINGIKNNEGLMQIGLYNTEVGFPDFDKSYQGTFQKADKLGVSYIFRSVPIDKYAVAVWHDENENEKMDKNMFGVPKESCGFSNNKFGTFGPPDFIDASFEVTGNKITKLTINLK